MTLGEAIKKDNYEKILERISRSNFDINRCCVNGCSALGLAVEHNKTKLVKTFLAMGANPNQRMYSDRTTYLSIALFTKKNYEIAELLLKNPKTRHVIIKYKWCIFDVTSPLMYAAKENDQKAVDLLLRYGANPVNYDGNNLPSKVAAKFGYKTLSTYLAEKEKQAKEKQAKEKQAKEKKKIPSLKRLIKQAYLDDPKIKLVFNNRPKGKDAPLPRELACFIQTRDECDGFYSDELKDNFMKAISESDIRRLKNLLNKELFIYDDVSCYLGSDTALHVAAKVGCLDIVKLLVKEGCQFSAKTRDGQTPEDLARKNGHNAVADYLKEEKRKQIEIFKEFMLKEKGEEKEKSANASQPDNNNAVQQQEHQKQNSTGKRCSMM